MFADLAGRGQYVGTVMSVTNAQDGWFGEGDDFFYIDGEEVPSLQGTGSEDYFNDAWGFRPRTSHWFGQPRWQGEGPATAASRYRWHVLDPVGFNKSLHVAIEHKGNDEDDTEAFYLERPDFISSVAFWYQTGEPKPFGAAAAVAGAPRAVAASPHGPRSSCNAKTTGGEGRWCERRASSARGRCWLAQHAKSVPADAAVHRGRGRHGTPCGSARLQESRPRPLCDPHRRKKVGDVDFRGPEESEMDVPLGTRSLAKGQHELMFEAKSISARQARPTRAKPMAVEMLRLLKLPPKAVREVKTDNEAHFVRLGIGRSLYAYRLAYGKLPDSLEDAGQGRASCRSGT